MADVSDRDLLRDYARQGSEEAFAALVRRHISFVHSAALRHVGISTHAEEITQVVFVILARKAAGLRPDTILEGWLYETTRLTSLSFIRGERRRQFREQEAYMQSTLEESPDPSVWNQLAPLLDEAMSRLARKDRDAVILRFFKDKSLREVATALRVNEAAAQRRVLRAVEKLRLFFTRRGIVLSAAVLIAAISANSVQAAPAALAKTATAVAFAKGAMASGSGLTLIQGALKAMAWTKAKTGIVVGIAVLATGTTGIVAKKLLPRPTVRSGRLLDGSRVVLENVTFGKTHVSPTGKPPVPFRFLPAKWLRGLKWNSGTPRTSHQETDMFVFWLQFSNSKGDESVRYAIADENGVEAPAVFNGPHWNYDPAGFGTNRVGQARSFGLLPRRSKKFYLRLYQQTAHGQPVRVADFPIENVPVRAVPGWVPSPLPVSQETNGLGFTLERAVVGILP